MKENHNQPVSSLSGRAALRLKDGPIDALTLMRDVCRVERLTLHAAERMAHALLGGRPEFTYHPTGLWALSSGYQLVQHDSPNGRAAFSLSVAIGSQLEQLSFAVVDVETTGLNATSGDRITEIAIVRVENGKVGDVYSQLVNPERPIPAFITSLTQISWEMVYDQPSFGEIAPQVCDRLRGTVFVGHNASFDWRFVSSELERATGYGLSGPKLCTVKLARALFPDLRKRSLDELTRYLGLKISSRHRAAGDAVATAQALCQMLGAAADRGLVTWEQLLESMGSSGGSKTKAKATRNRKMVSDFNTMASRNNEYLSPSPTSGDEKA